MEEESAVLMEGVENFGSSTNLEQDDSRYQAVQEQSTQLPQGR
ncbi:3039_t:CDS:1, partial [Ambispora gerdemannii]